MFIMNKTTKFLDICFNVNHLRYTRVFYRLIKSVSSLKPWHTTLSALLLSHPVKVGILV